MELEEGSHCGTTARRSARGRSRQQTARESGKNRRVGKLLSERASGSPRLTRPRSEAGSAQHSRGRRYENEAYRPGNSAWGRRDAPNGPWSETNEPHLASRAPRRLQGLVRALPQAHACQNKNERGEKEANKKQDGSHPTPYPSFPNSPLSPCIRLLTFLARPVRLLV